MLLNKVSVYSKQRVTPANKDLCLHQTEPLFEPTGHLYMFDFATCILYAVCLNPYDISTLKMTSEIFSRQSLYEMRTIEMCLSTRKAEARLLAH